MLTEADLKLKDGRRLHIYDTETQNPSGSLAVIWHHGTPNIGTPPEPLFREATRLNLRWVGYDRPSYGGSMPNLGRDIASAALDVKEIADALGLERFAVMGHSGGSPHALASAALLPERVVGVVSMAGLAPDGAEGLDWFSGMHPSGVASLQAAAKGRAAKERYEASAPPFDPELFTPADHAALTGPWSWLNSVVGPALAAGNQGLIDDDLAYVSPWGFDPAQIRCPLLLLHGGADRVVPSSHSQWLSQRCSSAELRLLPEDGHLSLLNSAEAALAWLKQQANHE